MVAPSSRPAGPRAPVVLVVEDEPVVLRALCETLARAGLEVEAASDAAAALAMCRVRHVDVAVLPSPADPGRDDLLARLRLLQPELAAVLVAESPVEGASAQQDFTLQKPFASEDLVHAVMRRLR